MCGVAEKYNADYFIQAAEAMTLQCWLVKTKERQLARITVSGGEGDRLGWTYPLGAR